jgi:hypothetical protein
MEAVQVSEDLRQQVRCCKALQMMDPANVPGFSFVTL